MLFLEPVTGILQACSHLECLFATDHPSLVRWTKCTFHRDVDVLSKTVPGIQNMWLFAAGGIKKVGDGGV